jgi:uncharacterized membrane protein
MIDPTAPKPHDSDNLHGIDPSIISKDLEMQFPSMKNVPQTDRVKMVQMVAEHTVTISGPIPPPSVLKGYNDIEPGLANRIVAMAESELAHDQKVHDRIVDSEVDGSKRDHTYRLLGLGLALAALIGMMVLVGYLATINQHWLAGIFGVGGMGAIVGMFINGRSGRAVEKPSIAGPPAKQSKKKR